MAHNDVVISADFQAPNLWQALEALRYEPAQYDLLAFGLVGMDLEGTVVVYNRAESVFAGVSAEYVIGLNFFTDVAPCTNNYIVSGRFEEASQLDETIDYTFTVKMKPARVRLRMLKGETGDRQYLVVAWE